MSLAESFLNTAREVLMITENIKRMDTRLDGLTDDLHDVDRRVMKLEVMVEIAQRPARTRHRQELP